MESRQMRLAPAHCCVSTLILKRIREQNPVMMDTLKQACHTEASCTSPSPSHKSSSRCVGTLRPAKLAGVQACLFLSLYACRAGALRLLREELLQLLPLSGVQISLLFRALHELLRRRRRACEQHCCRRGDKSTCWLCPSLAAALSWSGMCSNAAAGLDRLERFRPLHCEYSRGGAQRGMASTCKAHAPGGQDNTTNSLAV